MLFNSVGFIFFFLPIALCIYFFLNRWKLAIASKAWLVAVSLFFYGWWNPKYLFLLLASILLNYAVGSSIHKTKGLKKKSLLAFGLSANIATLGYFKYADFFIVNVNSIFSAELGLLNVILPLGISFFTFTQIAYLVDSYKSKANEYDLLNYCLFVTFFPHLLAGPILHHHQIMPQFMSVRTKALSWRNVSAGVFIFCAGLFKKIAIADSFAVWANAGFESMHALSFFEAWGASLSYTFQLYYDFSGYTDMAIGASLLFNIHLPINFNSPYKAKNIREFWQRWHITLSNWLRDYVYIPLGGNRAGKYRTYFNILITFLLGGLWHGAGWTFVAWGALHGVALVIHRFWDRQGLKMPALTGWFCTFMFVNAAWVFFRATTFKGAIRILEGMAGINGIKTPAGFADIGNYLANWSFLASDSAKVAPMMPVDTLAYIITFGFVAFLLPNAVQIIRFIPYKGAMIFKPRLIYALLVGLILFYALVSNIQNAPSQFLYFNF
ncbi:MAG: acetyltransferase [Deltaproteobacteria bacterium GWB2_55_19]|nr:MAG: acetyltransferase [Deltaproteobacteria bacterium GWB2_55_19]